MRAGRFAMELARAAAGAALLATAVSAQVATRVSVDSAGVEADDYSFYSVVAADGQIVAFESYASNLHAGDTNAACDVFVHDRSTGHTRCISVDASGLTGNSTSSGPSISADGQVVAFVSLSSNLVAGDTNGVEDVFIHDRSTGVTQRVSVDSSGAEGNHYSHSPSISADGHVVAFVSTSSNLVAGDTNGIGDAFVHDRTTGITERVSVDSTGAEGNGDSYVGLISADGRIVTFWSHATNLVASDTNKCPDTFVHDRSTGLTERVSVDASGTEGDSDSIGGAISADGQIVAFCSYAKNLVAHDRNRTWDIFVHDRSTGRTERVSMDSLGAEANGSSFEYRISADGQVVVFTSTAANLVAGDTNGASDVFVHNRSNGFTDRVSVELSGAEGNDDCYSPAISADAHVVTFESYASNLVTGDTNECSDVFLHVRSNAIWSNYGTGFPGTNGVPSLTAQAPPVLGSTLTLDLANSWGTFTNGLVFFGFQRATIPTSWGGDLLVVPVITELVGVDAGGRTLGGVIPNDPSLVGTTFDLQAIELDPGAAKGVSFTPGLELVFGY